ncbi:alpha-L-fucosidase [Microbacterium hydrocarbonoxydans]|uniref:alpha-L-fucosidase n=1 Tax=Microbacterium hydrocarbonoxydans TaxID=273678 RepID=UPI0007BC106C|nr:alpha-L-fucosidase [Microbacterium hydrocarbonoxydans]GAT71799.1 alpha-L-fucosidase [Microbacterium sp. HM58-2]
MTDLSWVPEALPARDDAAELARVDAVVAAGPFDDTWDSLRRHRTARWFGEAKFGIFIHWGVFSVPAFESEWYARNMYWEGTSAFRHHIDVHGPHTEFGYKDFIPQFRMQDFDPVAWAALFRRAGAQYVVPVAEHHDGFAMYSSDRTRWDAAKAGPRRDVFGALAAEVRALSMTFGASSHRAEHWFYMNGGQRFDSDVRDPAFADFYGPAQREETSPSREYLDDWLLRTVEVIDRYRPELLWFDWWIETPAFEPYLRRLAAYYYNSAAAWGREVVINYKWDAFMQGSAVYDIERGAMATSQPVPWQNDSAVSRSSWCWTEGQEYKPASELLGELLDVVSKNGNLLLNIGPKPDGTIAAAEVELLERLGAWLSVNGEAIYGTIPYVVPGEGPLQVEGGSFVDGTPSAFGPEDFRFTVREDVTGSYLYASTPAWPADGDDVVLTTLARRLQVEPREIHQVRMLGVAEPLAWERHLDGLRVRLPAERPNPDGYALKLSFVPESPRPRTDFLHQT